VQQWRRFGPDEQIRDDVIKQVIAGDFALNPNAFDVTVKSGS